MADNGIKKATIKKEDLPPIDGNINGYVVRYRIITEDRNRSSHWSPRYTVLLDSIATVPTNQRSVVVAGDGSTKTLTAVWVPPVGFATSSFDVYIKVGSGEYEYRATVSTPTYATILQSGVQASLAVQILTNPKKRFSNLTLFEEVGINV